MNSSATYEVSMIISELRSVIRELESIESGVRNDFRGIGNEKCADCIGRVTDRYRYVLGKLQNMDTATVTESFAKSNGLA